MLFIVLVVLVCIFQGADATGLHFVAKQLEPDAVQLNWDKCLIEECKFEIHYRKKGAQDWISQFENHDVSSTWVEGLESRIAYEFRLTKHILKKKDSASILRSELSAIIVVTLPEKLDASRIGTFKQKRSVSTPHQLRIETRGNSVFLTWSFNEPQKDMQFVVKYRKNGESNWRQSVTREHSLELKNLEYGANYEIQVLAQSGGVKSLPSSVVEIPIPVRQEGSGQQAASQVITSGSLPSPSNLRAALISSSEVQLTWTPVKIGNEYAFYAVEVQQVGHGNSAPFYHYSNHAVISSLSPGQTYNFNVKTRYKNQESYPSTVTITIPANQRIIVPGGLKIRTSTENPKEIQLIWAISAPDQALVRGYTVYFTEDRTSQEWTKRTMVGGKPELAIFDMKPSTQYFARIETQFLDSRPDTSSSIFRFTTPQAQPIKNIKLVYNVGGTIGLEWILYDFVKPSDLENTKILWTTDKSLPEAQWKTALAGPGEVSLNLPEKLEPYKTYYVKIYPHLRGQGMMKTNTIFQFETKEQRSAIVDTIDYHLTFLPVGTDGFTLKWELPANREIMGTHIMYTQQARSLPETQWNRLYLPKGTTEVTLHSLDRKRVLFVSIKPQTATGFLQQMHYEIKPFTKRFQRHSRRQLCLQACHVMSYPTNALDAKTEDPCPEGEICVPHCEGDETNDCGTGWCLPRTLAQSASAVL